MRNIKKHTIQKLKFFEKYINAYLKVTQKLPKRYYIDAFAGTGQCNCLGLKNAIDGSTLIALKAKGNFDKYIFIDRNGNNIKQLQSCIDKENIDTGRASNVNFHKDDANDLIPRLASGFSQPEFKYIGFMVFLDPEGSELHWSTIESLARINKIDILILYPYDMGLARLTKNYPDKINLVYGTEEWKPIFNNRLSPSEARQKLLELYQNNLRKLGFTYVVYKHIKTGFREGKPLYHLVFATKNATAAKIITDIFNKELDGQQKLLKLC